MELAQEMRIMMAMRLTRLIREGHRVGWLIAKRLKMKKLAYTCHHRSMRVEG